MVTVLPLSVVVSVHSVPLPFSLPFAALTPAKTLIPAPLPPAPILTPTPPPLLLFLPVVFCVFAAPLNRISFAASRLVLPPALSWLPAITISPRLSPLFLPVATTDRLFPAFSVLPDTVSLSECCCDFDFWVVSDRLTPIAFGSPVAVAIAAACPACTPDSAVFVACRAFRRLSLLSFVSCALVTALLMALPTVPERATVSPLFFCSNFSSTVRRSCPGSTTTLSPVMLISRFAITSEPLI